MLSYIWRQLLQRKVRTALSMLGVSVSVAGIVALISVAQGMRTSMDRFMLESGASLIVMSRDAAGVEHSAVSQEEVDKIAAIDGVEATARASFKAQMFPLLAKQHTARPMLFVLGRFPDERLIQRYRDVLVEGRLPRERHEVIVGENVAKESGIKQGDTMRLFHKEHFGIKEYEVVGVYNSSISWENAGIVVHGDVAIAEAGKILMVFLYTKGSDSDRVREAVHEAFPHLVAVSPQEFMSRFSSQLEVLDSFIMLITVIAMIVGILGVLNTMMMSVSERTREIGMLRALGWSRGLIVRLIVTEGMVLSLVGGLIGLVMGVVGTETLIRVFPGGWLDAVYTPTTFLYGGTVALTVGVLAALYPAVRAANLKPVEALRYE